MKRRIEYDGNVYVVKSDRIELPDLNTLDRFSALQWLCRHTYARGYSKAPNPLAGLGGAIQLGSR